MGSNGKQLQWNLLGQIIIILIINLQLQCTAMGSNGKQHLDQIIIVIIYNLQLQWTPMVNIS